MITDEFLCNVELYKRGLYDQISWYDPNTKQIFKFHDQQIKALELLNDDITTFVGYAGSARSGKTVLMCAAAVFECWGYDGVRNLLGRKDLQMLWKTTWKSLNKVLDMFGLENEKDYTFNGKHYEMTFPNDSQIIAKNLELKPSDTEATAFGSLEITKAYIDQSEHVSLKIIEKIQERVGSHKSFEYGIKGKVMETFNPSKTHVHRRYWVPFREKRESKTKKFVRALPSDNPGKEAKEWLRQKQADFEDGTFSFVEYQKQVLGNFDYDDDPDALIEHDAILDLWTNEAQTGKMYITADIAFQGSDRAVFGVWDGLKLIHVTVKELMTGKEGIEILTNLKSEYSVRNSNICYDNDGVGAGLSGWIRGAKQFNNGAKPFKGENYQNLKTQCYYYLAKYINQGKIQIACELNKDDLSQELGQVKSYQTEKDGKLKILPKKKIIENIGRSPDIADMLMMRMYYEARPKVTGEVLTVSI